MSDPNDQSKPAAVIKIADLGPSPFLAEAPTAIGGPGAKEQVTGFGLGGALKMLAMFSTDEDTRQVAAAAGKRIAELVQGMRHINKLCESGLAVTTIIDGVQEIANSALSGASK